MDLKIGSSLYKIVEWRETAKYVKYEVAGIDDYNIKIIPQNHRIVSNDYILVDLNYNECGYYRTMQECYEKYAAEKGALISNIEDKLRSLYDDLR